MQSTYSIRILFASSADCKKLYQTPYFTCNTVLLCFTVQPKGKTKKARYLGSSEFGSQIDKYKPTQLTSGATQQAVLEAAC